MNIYKKWKQFAVYTSFWILTEKINA